MRLSSLAVSLLALAISARAQYFSEGWKPGQPVYTTTDGAAPEPTFTPKVSTEHDTHNAPSGGLKSLFDINKILTSEPVASLFSKVGINITDRVASATNIWDERIPLITDDNYKELIVNEPLSLQEAHDRTWVIVITVASNGQDGISKYVDQMFDSAFNETQIANDLPNIRWGRIDYLNVTYITTKWNVWQAPYLVVLKDKGQTLRFYRPGQLHLKDEAFREFLKTEGWQVTPPWSSLYSPGGEREYLMDFFATWSTKIYNVTVLIPRWMLLILSGGIGSLVLSVLHRPSATLATAQASGDIKSASVAPTIPLSQSIQSDNSDGHSSGSPAPKRSSTRQRKVKK